MTSDSHDWRPVRFVDGCHAATVTYRCACGQTQTVETEHDFDSEESGYRAQFALPAECARCDELLTGRGGAPRVITTTTMEVQGDINAATV